MARLSDRCARGTEASLNFLIVQPGAHRMTRQLALLGSAICVVLSAGAANAVDLPMKMVRTGGPMPEITMQHCTDETTDKEMSTAASPMAKEVCSKHDVQKTATGYVSDSVCSVAGMTVQGHSEIVGDFNSAYTVKSTSHSEGGAAGTHDTTMTIEAKWLGACKSDQKPGDIIMPGGMKMNVKDMEKLKALLPKQK
jgi:Protein of unknown function (DUF3617)